METNKVPTSTSTTVSATSAVINPLFDPVALQTAYFAAAQLHNQLQQNSHLTIAVNTTAISTSTITTTTANNIHTALHKTTTQSSPLTACLSSFVDNERLYSLLPPQLQSCLKQQQRNFLQQQQSINTSLAHHFSAFSPINTDLSGGAVTSTTSSLFTQPSSLPSIPPVPSIVSSQQPLDLLLMQMQMATAAAAAAAGFFPAAFSVLPPVTAATLGLLTPQFRMLQLADPNFSTYTASANGSGIFTSDTISKSADDTSTIERSLLQAQINLLANGSSLSSIAKEHTYRNNTVSDILSNDVASSLTQLNPASNHNSSLHHDNNGGKQQRIQMKRPYDEMSILRSLCNENHITEQETEMICGKRSRLGITDESGQRNSQKFMKAYNSGKDEQQQQQQYLVEANNDDSSDESSKTSKKNKEKCAASSLLDENSPDRHHPLNHRPPAMEARFLECMAAIALHSNIPLPMNDENMIRNISASENRQEKNDINGKSDKHKQSAKDIELKNSSRIELGNIPSPNRPKSYENISLTTIASNENRNKKCWPNSAIDEELCKELENYKDSDVPVIHAFVLPAKLSDSASSPTSDKKYSQDLPCTMVPESLAVPVPILNTLLDRILQTMLNP
ncbi:putative ubiquitin thioesterase [Dirofilaria immitis]